MEFLKDKAVPVLNYLSVTPSSRKKNRGIAPPFLTSALDRSELSSRSGGFTLRKGPPVLIGWEAEWIPEPVWPTRSGQSILQLPGTKPDSVAV
jgi:hypothetical protein